MQRVMDSTVLKTHPSWRKYIKLQMDHFSFLNNFLMFIYVFFERESLSGGGAEREKERESQAGYTLSTEPNTGLDFTTLRSWPEPKSRVRRLTNWATQTPPSGSFLKGVTLSTHSADHQKYYIQTHLFSQFDMSLNQWTARLIIEKKETSGMLVNV